MIASFSPFWTQMIVCDAQSMRHVRPQTLGLLEGSQHNLDLILVAWLSVFKPIGSAEAEVIIMGLRPQVAAEHGTHLRILVSSKREFQASLLSLSRQKMRLRIYQVVPRVAGGAGEAHFMLSFQERCPKLSRRTDRMKESLLPPSGIGHMCQELSLTITATARVDRKGKGVSASITSPARIKNWSRQIWLAVALPRVCGRGQRSPPDLKAEEVFAACQDSHGKEFSNVQREEA